MPESDPAFRRFGALHFTMQRPLQEHIASLEQKIASLNEQLKEPGRSAEFQKGLRLHLEIAETSLALFRRAYDLEKTISK
jgi:exonuclease VII small subunit